MNVRGFKIIKLIVSALIIGLFVVFYKNLSDSIFKNSEILEEYKNKFP